MSAYGDDPRYHAIEGGGFVCTAPEDAPCRTSPTCECEDWCCCDGSPEDAAANHGGEHCCMQTVKPGQGCWIEPWMNTDLDARRRDRAASRSHSPGSGRRQPGLGPPRGGAMSVRFACRCGRFLPQSAIRETDFRDDSRYYGIRTEVEWDCSRCGLVKGEEWEPQLICVAPHPDAP